MMKAWTRFGNPIRCWNEDGGMPNAKLWVFVDSMGVVGLVWASAWETAWECVVDEILPDADPDDVTEDEHGGLGEGFSYRSGAPSSPGINTLVAAHDLNGEQLLGPLTRRMADAFGLRVDLRDDD